MIEAIGLAVLLVGVVAMRVGWERAREDGVIGREVPPLRDLPVAVGPKGGWLA